MTFSYQGGLTARISAAELGNTKAFKFFVVAISGLIVDPVTGDLDGANSKADVAPGGGVGLFPYTVTIAKPTLVVRGLTTTPSGAEGGPDVHDAHDDGALGLGRRPPERPRDLRRPRRDDSGFARSWRASREEQSCAPGSSRRTRRARPSGERRPWCSRA